jgi:hypothetical protein
MPRPKTQSTSPVVVKKLEVVQSNLTFDAAIKCVMDGAHITKAEWSNPEYYGLLKNSFLMLHKPDGKFYQWIISEGDMIGIDWSVIS